MKIFKVFLLSFCIPLNLLAGELVTVAESSNYTKTSLYEDIMTLLFEAQNKTEAIQVLTFCKSFEGRDIPLVVISEEGISSPYELKMVHKPAVLIMANIHPGEVEGKEACLMLIRDIAQGKHSTFLKNQVILVIPDFNADGNEKLGKDNREDNGPELVGVRHNGQNLDLNRDYVKVETPEITGLLRLFNEWDPVLFVDMHTKDGSYHREPVTYCTFSNPNSDQEMMDFMWQILFPEVQTTLKKEFGYDAIPYGNFVDRTKPGKGWENTACEARYGTNYVGLRNRFTILDENYPYADFKTRVLSSYGFIQSVLQFTNGHAIEMQKMVEKVDLETWEDYYKEKFILEFKIEKLFDLTVKSYKFELEKIDTTQRDKYPWWVKDIYAKKTDVERDYDLPYLAKAVPVQTINLPLGYIILPGYDDIIEKLGKHGIVVKRINKAVKLTVEQFKLEEIKPSDRLYQGHVDIALKGNYETIDLDVPKNSYYISMKQPLARIIPVLLEPKSMDSLVCWGFFNKVLIVQWGINKPNMYPVFRIHQNVNELELIQN